MPADSVLDERFNLRDLLDPPVMREVCELFTELFNLQVAVFDEDKKELFTTSVDFPLCRSMRSGPFAEWCASARDYLVSLPLEDPKMVQVKAKCGMRYLMIPLSYQLELLGRAIIGPFRTRETTLEQVRSALGPAASPELGEEMTECLPLLEAQEVKAAVRLLSKIFSVLLFTNAKRLITTRLHLEILYSNREEIFRQVELQDSGTEEDKKEIEKLKDMF